MRILIYGLRGEVYEQSGGLQLNNLRLANYLVDRGHTVVLAGVTPFSREKVFFPLNAAVILDVVALPRSCEDISRFSKELRNLLTRYEIDVVAVLQSGGVVVYVGLAVQDLPIPLLGTERGEPSFVLLNYKSSLFRYSSFSLCDRIHLLFDEYKKTLPENLAERCRVIGSPVMLPGPEDDQAKPGAVREGEPVRLLSVGRLSYEKDLFTLVRAFSKLRQDGLNCVLQVVGGGPLCGEIEEEAKRLRVSSWIEFVGERSFGEVASYYQRAHLFVTTSLTEGCPLSLREAMAFGLPVVAGAEAQGIRLVFKDCPGGGLLVPRCSEESKLIRQVCWKELPHDAVPWSRAERFAEQMKRLILDPDARVRLGRRGSQLVLQYASDVIHQKWERLFFELLSLKGRRAIHCVQGLLG